MRLACTRLSALLAVALAAAAVGVSAASADGGSITYQATPFWQFAFGAPAAPAAFPAPSECVAAFGLACYTPQLIRTAYDVPSRLNGAGQSIVIVDAFQATGTTAEVTFSGLAMTMKQNRTLAARWVANAEAYGIVDQGADPNSGSTDMGNVSWVCPTIHPDLSIADEGTPGHSIAFRDAATTCIGSLGTERRLLDGNTVAGKYGR